MSGLDNDTQRVERIRLGALWGIDSATTNGTYYFDAFQSQRESYIGSAIVIADFTADQVYGMPRLSVTFTNLSKPASKITSYEWDFGDGTPTSSEVNPVHTYTDFGDYTVTLTVTGPEGTVIETKSEYIHVSEEIFSDGFESGDTGAWSASVVDIDDLSVTTGAAMVGTYGMQVLIDDSNQVYVTDYTPDAESRYRARFYFDPNSITMAHGDYHYILWSFSPANKSMFMIGFQYAFGSYRLRITTYTDTGSFLASAWQPISDEGHFVEIDWQAASGAGANDGQYTLWIDGEERSSMSGLDNDTQRVERIRLGALWGIDSATTNGTYFFDAFQSQRMNYIGE
jgi:PKD repeat protein